MASASDVFNLVKEFSENSNSGYIHYNQFLSYSKFYATRYESDNDNYEDLRVNTHAVLSKNIRKLEAEGLLTLESENNKNTRIIYNAFFFERIHQTFTKIIDDFTIPFPARQDINIPNEVIQPLALRDNFLEIIKTKGEERDRRIVCLSFPNNIEDMLTTTLTFDDLLPMAAIQKIRFFLLREGNLTHVQHKVHSLFPGKEIVTCNVLESIAQSLDKAFRNIQEANKFISRIWLRLLGISSQEILEKHATSVDDLNVIQSAYILGYYCSMYQGRQQEIQFKPFKKIREAMQNAPYYFTYSNLSQIYDEDGKFLLEGISKLSFQSFVQNEMNCSEKQQSLLKIQASNSLTYYMYLKFLPQILEELISKASKELCHFYSRSWSEALLNYQALNTMENDRELSSHIWLELQRNYPLLNAILDQKLLSSIVVSTSVWETVREGCRKYLNANSTGLRPIYRILGIDRRRILAEIYANFPTWYFIPLIQGAQRLLRTVFFRKPAKEFDHKGQGRINPKRLLAQLSANHKHSRSKNPQPSHVSKFPIATTKRADYNEIEPYLKGISKRNLKAKTNPYFSHPIENKMTGSPFIEKKTIQGTSQNPQFLHGELENMYDSRSFGTNTRTTNRARRGSLNDNMDRLIQKWNPLIDERMRENLVEDVKSVCRDYLRRRRRHLNGLKSDPNRIREISHSIAEADVFNRVLSRDALEQYVQLYLVQQLSSSEM